MSTTQDIESFTGSSWKECSTFIQRVRAAAWQEGKLRDPDWMADFASLYFSDDALAWYCRLSPDVQENWPKLQAALAEQWSPPGGDDRSEPVNVPVAAAAAAPSGKANDKADHLDRGILKVSVHGKEEAFYLQMKPGKTTCTLTSNVENALRFRFDSRSNSTLFECADRQSFSWLATHWYQNNPDLGRNSTHFSRLTIVDDTLKSPAGTDGPFQLTTLRVKNSGEVMPFWRNGTTETPLAVFASVNVSHLALAPDREAFQKHYFKEIPATLFIQRVD